MAKTIVLTGATDGIGYETAKRLLSDGHHVVLHGRNAEKLAAVNETLSKLGSTDTVVADLSNLEQVKQLAEELIQKYPKIDVLLNNAGIFRTPHTETSYGIDIRFVVNTLAPYLLTKGLMSAFIPGSRVVNLSSAAQAPVDLQALVGQGSALEAMSAYSQSKLAITMWTRQMAKAHQATGVSFIAVNPGSLLASKMVKEGFGVAGKDLGIGADILTQAALSDTFKDVSGQYFDNDSGQFSSPHPAGLDDEACQAVVEAMDGVF